MYVIKKRIVKLSKPQKIWINEMIYCCFQACILILFLNDYGIFSKTPWPPCYMFLIYHQYTAYLEINNSKWFCHKTFCDIYFKNELFIRLVIVRRVILWWLLRVLVEDNILCVSIFHVISSLSIKLEHSDQPNTDSHTLKLQWFLLQNVCCNNKLCSLFKPYWDRKLLIN